MRTVVTARNPKWGDSAQTFIDVEVNFEELPEQWVMFTATPYDSEPHGVQIYNNCINGDYGAIQSWTVPENISGELASQSLRNQRTSLLEETDWVENYTVWTGFTDEKRAEWESYRNKLRSLPQDYPNAYLAWDLDSGEYTWRDVVWPTKP